MTLARTLGGLVTLAGTAAPAAAQLNVMPAPTTPNRIVYPAPPWITNGLRPGVASTVYATPPAAQPADANAVRPTWTGPQPPAAATPAVSPAPAPELAPAPRQALAPVAPAVEPPTLPTVPSTPSSSTRAAPGSTGAVIPKLPTAPSTLPVPPAGPAVVPPTLPAVPAAPVTPTGGTAHRSNPGIVDRAPTPVRPLYRPASPSSATARPDVWAPGGSTPATLPGSITPTAPRR